MVKAADRVTSVPNSKKTTTQSIGNVSQAKQQVRERFRIAVFTRDHNKCRVCGGAGPLDAHHITDRNDLPNGGYVKENGITLCPSCHLKAEVFHKSGGKNHLIGFLPQDLYILIGSSKEIAIKASQRL